MTQPTLLSVGDNAPVFTAQDQTGKDQSLSDYNGSWLLLYFYPKDDTPGCTTEACSFRDNLDVLLSKGIAVIGVSADSVSSHQKFAKKFELTFPLLADTDKKIVEAYGVWGEKSMYGKTYQGIHRVSYLINPSGHIAKVYPNVKPAEHVAEVLADIQEFLA